MEWKKELEYKGGSGKKPVYNTGSMLADDSQGFSREDSPMLLVGDTSEEEYRAYVEGLAESGFRTVFERNNEAFCCCQLEREGMPVYVYFTRRTREVRVIEDRASVSLKDFCFAGTEETSAEIYQYGLYYDPNNSNTPVATNCGMLYIIRLEDNSLVMIDGGHRLQCSRKAVEGMYAFLRRITGTKEGEKIRIAAWFFTHAHDDHMAACVRLVRTWPEVFVIERVMFNFLPYTLRASDGDMLILRETLREYCPEVKCLKLHTGQVISLGNVSFDVMHTHEDMVWPECEEVFPVRDFNCSSVILKMTTGTGTMMWLGDTGTETETLAARNIPPALWKSDVVQIAHHSFNYLTILYRLIDADYLMVPNSNYGAHAGSNRHKLMDAEKLLPCPQNMWYEEKTTGFRFEEGRYRVILEEELVGGEHDGTDLYGRQAI